MRPFGRIPTSLWEEIAALSIEAKALLVYLLSSRHTTMIGCFRLPIAYAMEDLGISSGTVSEGFMELSRNGFLVRDLEASWVLVPDFLRWNPIENPNQGKAATKHFDNVPPYSSVYAPLVEALKKYHSNLPVDFLKGLETLPKPYRNIEPEPEPEPDPSAPRDQKPSRAAGDQTPTEQAAANGHQPASGSAYASPPREEVMRRLYKKKGDRNWGPVAKELGVNYTHLCDMRSKKNPKPWSAKLLFGIGFHYDPSTGSWR